MKTLLWGSDGGTLGSPLGRVVNDSMPPTRTLPASTPGFPRLTYLVCCRNTLTKLAFEPMPGNEYCTCASELQPRVGTSGSSR